MSAAGLTVALLTPSALMRRGLCSLLAAMTDVSVTVHDFSAAPPSDLEPLLHRHKPSVLVADPMLLPPHCLEAVRRASVVRLRVVALTTSPLPQSVAAAYDEVLTAYDSDETAMAMFGRMADSSDDAAADKSRELSPRERTVVIGVVKGLSNKEIAAEMNVSVNTIMTHRRNIAAKLQIHSAAGLTIYAIVRKLVKIDEITPTSA